MSPSIFMLNHPIQTYDVLYGIYIYVLGIGLAFSWTALAWLDLAERKPASALFWAVGVVVLPLIGGGFYLLTCAKSLTCRARIAIVLSGLVLWGAALGYGLPKIWGPLGPKALSTHEAKY